MLKSPKNGRYTPQNWRNPGTTRMSNTQTANPPTPKKVSVTPWGGGGGVVLLRILDWGGMCGPVLQILTLFHTKRCHFPHPFSDLTSKIHTSFQTWRRSQNATYMFRKTEIRSSLLGLRAPTKKYFLKSNNNNNNTLFLPNNIQEIKIYNNSTGNDRGAGCPK